MSASLDFMNTSLSANNVSTEMGPDYGRCIVCDAVDNSTRQSLQPIMKRYINTVDICVRFIYVMMIPKTAQKCLSSVVIKSVYNNWIHDLVHRCRTDTRHTESRKRRQSDYTLPPMLGIAFITQKFLGSQVLEEHFNAFRG